jgi:hypothetical protein
MLKIFYTIDLSRSRLMTLDVNFINILRTAFVLVDPESIKITVKSSVFFYTFGIYKRKAVRRMLMKLSPDHYPIIIHLYTYFNRNLQ